MNSTKRSSLWRFDLTATGGLPATAVVAAAVPLLVRLDLRRLHRRLEPPSRFSRCPSAEPGRQIALVGRRMDRVIRWGKPLVRPGCLTRGLPGITFCGALALT